MPWGLGHAMFGGMTTTNFHSPQPNATNLRTNILYYLTTFGCQVLSAPEANEDGMLFFENFESGYDDWTMDGLWNPENQADACGSLVAPFPSPFNAAYFGLDGVCNYDITGVASGTLTLNTLISLPPDTVPILLFSSYEQTECTGNCVWDNRYVEISTDGGATWMPLGEVGNENTWYQAGFDLAAYAGQNVQVRFRFDSVDGEVDDLFGWMVDDISIVYSLPYFMTDEDSPFITPNVLFNDWDADGDPIALDSYDTSGLLGALTDNGDGTFLYDPNGAFDYLAPGEQAVDSFTYVISDSIFTDTASVYILVTGLNDAPVTVEDTYSTPEDTALNVGAPGVLLNDLDPEGDPMAAELVDGPAVGSLTFNANGSFNYTPEPDYNGAVTFTYAVTDGVAWSAFEPLDVTFGEPEFPLGTPVAGYMVNTLYGLPIPPLSFNFEVNGVPVISATFTTSGPGTTYYGIPPYIVGPTNGTLSVDFGADVGYAGFGFVVACPPVPVSDAITVTAYAADSSPLGTFYADAAPINSSWPENWIDITPGVNFRSLEIDLTDACFAFAVDGLAYDVYTGPTLVTIDVTPVNDAPVADDQAITTAEDTPYLGVLTASDIDLDALTFSLDTAPANGSVTVAANGDFVYTPTLNYNGADSFTFEVSDGTLSDIGQVDITVTPVNDAPVADDQAITVVEDTPYLGALTASDVDLDALTFNLDTAPANGSVTVAANGDFVYTPTLNYNGADSFTFEVSDGTLSDIGQVDITVTPVNDDPTVDAGLDQAVDEAELVSFDGSYLDPGLLNIQAITVTWDFGDGDTAIGTLTPTHTYADDGVYTVTLTVEDGEGGSDVDELLVTVANVAPTLSAIADQNVVAGVVFTVTAAFTDPGWLDTHTVDVDWNDGNTDSFSPPLGTESYPLSHAYAAAGTYTVTVTVTDDDGGVDEITFLVTVTTSGYNIWLPVINK